MGSHGETGYYLGVDIGATNIRCGVTTAGRERVATLTRPTPQGPTVGAFTDGVETAVAEALDSARIRPSQVAAAGIASFGPLDTAAGLIRQTANLDSNLRDIPVRRAVESQLPGVPVRLCNDAVAGVVAEYCADPAENLAYVTLSSGIGAGVVVDGHVLRGEDGNAAEVGHLTLDPDSGRPCGCGGDGHWEAFAGGENVPAYAADVAAEEGFDDTLLAGECTAATVFDADGDDPLATETIERIGDWNAQGMAALVHAFAPSRVVVGGAVARNNERRVLDPIRNRIDSYLMGPTPEIRLTAFGDEVTLRGALALAAGDIQLGRNAARAGS